MVWGKVQDVNSQVLRVDLEEGRDDVIFWLERSLIHDEGWLRRAVKIADFLITSFVNGPGYTHIFYFQTTEY